MALALLAFTAGAHSTIEAMGLRAGPRPRRALRPPGSVLAIGLALALASAPSLADTTRVRDQRNSDANRFDIRFAIAGHLHGHLYHVIRTYRPWRSSELRSTRREPRAICIYIWHAKSDAREQQDYEVCATWKNGRLRGSVFHARPQQRITGTAVVRRTNSRSISFSFLKASIGHPRYYRWQAITGYTGPACPRDPPYQFGCDDSAPTRSTAVHVLVPSRRHEATAPAAPAAGASQASP
jgi:hypothetical protein